MEYRKAWLAACAGLLIALGFWLAMSGGAPAPGSGSAAVWAQPSLSSTSRSYLPLIVHSYPLVLPEKIAFETPRDGNYEIYWINPDGSEELNWTDNPAKDVAPAWSPDGQRLAFVSDRDGNEEIYIMNRDGSGLVRLTYDPADDDWPAWSPDGQRIAFQSDRRGNYDIYVMNADGSNQTPITHDGAKDRWPDWSPDGTRIAFTSNRLGVKKVYTMNPDGSNLTLLSKLNVGYDDRYSTWSRDGRITFVSNRPAPSDGSGDDEIYIMNANGRNVQQLTDNDAGDWLARWSPDGERFAFYSNRDGNKNIFVKALATGAESRLTDDPDDEEYPAWSP